MSLNGKESKPGQFEWCRSKDGQRAQYVEFQPGGKEKRQTCDFRNGLPDGPFSAWLPGGKVWIAGQFSAGVPDGRWRQWDKTGLRVAEGEYRRGRFVAGAPVASTAVCDKLRPL
jgi:antitoxin component YwqK of YwqJK toxin-antitoxin module